jgi:copper(I)-binding protein
MLTDLHGTPKEGETFPLTLKLAEGGTLDVRVKVKAMDAMSDDHGDHEHEG